MPIFRDLLAGGEVQRRSRLPRLTGTSTPAGVSVDAERSLQVSAVYGCVRLISEAIAQLPVHVYRRTDDSRVPVANDPLIPLLTRFTNADIDSGEFYRSMVGWMLLRGNGFAYREIDSGGRTVNLWPIAPTSVSLARSDSGRLVYKVALNEAEYVPGFESGVAKKVRQEQMLHFRAFGMGTWGLSPVGMARTKVATSFAAEEYGAGFFSRGATPGGVLTTDQSLTDEQFDRLNAQWKESHGGFGKSHKPAILEGGMTWENVGLPPAEAQFLETQKYTASTIAGHIYFVPPHLIGDVERSTSWGAGIAEQGVAFVRYSLMPWIVRLERVLNRLFVNPDYYVKFNTAALERGDIATRYEAYAMGKQWGWLSTNDILRKEDEAPVKGGDVYLQPLNMVEAGRSLQQSGPARTIRRSAEARRNIQEKFAPLIASADEQVAEVERSEVEELVRQHLVQGGSAATFIAAIEELYGEEIADVARDAFAPVFGAYAAAIATEAAEEVGGDAPELDRWVKAYTDSHVDYRMARAVHRLRNVATDPEAADLVRVVLDENIRDRPKKTARWESTQLSRAATREAWRDSGVRELRWVTNGDNCEICQRLDGRVVGIEEPFARKGDYYPGGEDQDPLIVGRSTFHPPIHPGCDCDIRAT